MLPLWYDVDDAATLELLNAELLHDMPAVLHDCQAIPPSTLASSSAL